MKYHCECCNYVTTRNNDFQKHLKTKKHLVKNNESPQSHHLVTPKSPFSHPKVTFFSEKSRSALICKYCNKEFKYKQGMYRHIKYSCKKNKDEDIKELARLLNEQNQQNKLKEKEIEIMKKQIDKLSNKLQIQSLTVNNNTNNTLHNTLNIQLLNHNDTDYTHLSDNDYINCIKQNNFCVKQLIESVHFNTEKPENKNIYISNIKTNYVMLYKDNKWQIVNRKEQIDNLYEYNEIVLEEWYENYKDKDNEMINSFTRYLKSKEDNEILNSIKNEILLLLYNNRLIENN